MTDPTPILCGSCYPAVGSDTTYCDPCLRKLHAELEGEMLPGSFTALVDNLFQSRVPKRQWHATPADLMPKLQAVDPLTTGALLFGKSGLGKSFQAAALVRRGIEFAASSGKPPNAIEFQWVTALGLIEQLKGEFGKSPARSVAQAMIEARMLVLDDIGTVRLVDERKSDWAYGRLLDIIDSRYAQMRPTIATSNLTPNELALAVGERVTGRLVEGAVLLRVVGEQRRAPMQAGAA